MKNEMKTKVMIAGAAFCAALFLFSGFMLCREYLDQKQSAEAFEEVAELVKEEPDLPVLELESGPEPVQEEMTAFDKYANVYAQNSDLVGWVSIPGTRIDYPVMQSSQEEPDYYLKHDFDKNDDLNGTLFIDARNDYINRDTNIIIYGHNMKSGMMFGELKKYLDEDFYNAHKTIEFNTLYERGVYEVIEVGLSEVQYQDENVFRYYNFLNADSEEEYQEYLNNVAQLSVYGTEIDSAYGDQLLTLSTCNNYTQDGRMFILAKRVQ